MDFGVIDIGSNSIRLSIYRCNQAGAKLLYHQKRMAKLAAHIEDGLMCPKGVRLAGEILLAYRETMEKYNVDDYGAFATAALRNVRNSAQVVGALCASTGVSVELLSGKEEARLGLLGCHDYKMRPGSLFCDIGGGSTELALAGAMGNAEQLASLPIGALSLYRRHAEDGACTKRALLNMKGSITKEINALGWVQHSPDLYAVGGTARSLYRTAHILLGTAPGQRDFSGQEIAQMYSVLRGDQGAEIVAAHMPERNESILPGALILCEITRAFRCRSVHLCDGGVREGYLIDHFVRERGRVVY